VGGSGDRTRIADAATERWGIFNVDGIAVGTVGNDGAFTCDHDAARDDGAVNQIPALGARMTPLSTIAPWIVLAEMPIPVCEPETVLALTKPPVRNVLETTTTPAPLTVPALVTPPLKVAPLTNISVKLLVTVAGRAPDKPPLRVPRKLKASGPRARLRGAALTPLAFPK
jgi:hypothetical protein